MILAVGLGTGVFPDGAQHLAQCDLAQRLDFQGQGAYQQFVEHHAQRVYANTSGIPGAGTDDPKPTAKRGTYFRAALRPLKKCITKEITATISNR